MAEIVGVIGSSVSIFDALQKLYRFSRDIYNAGTERTDFLNRLGCVDTVIKAIEGCKASSTSTTSWQKQLSEKEEDNTPVYRLLETMKAIAKILTIDPNDTRKRAKLKDFKWHSEKKEVDKLLGQVKDHCISILVVLQWGEVEILQALSITAEKSAEAITRIEASLEDDRKARGAVDTVVLDTAKNVEDGRKENQETAQVIRMTAHRLESMEARIQAEEEVNRKERERIERKAVENWLSPLEFQNRQQTIFEKAASFQKGRIGKWFFDSDEYKFWKEGLIKVLRGYGDPGAGKTILSSVIVEELSKVSPDTPVLCIYLEKAERLVHTTKNLLGSLLKQLIQFKEHGLASSIQAVFQKASRTNTAPNLKEVQQLLKAEIESHPRVFVVVDGLDEASDEARGPFESLLRKLQSLKLSILFMSRKDDVTNPLVMHCDSCDRIVIRYYRCQDCKKVSKVPRGICFKCKQDNKTCVHDKTHLLQEFTESECEVEIKTPHSDIALFLKTSIEDQFPEELEDTTLSSPRRGIREMVWQCYHKPEIFTKIVQYIVDNADGRFLLAREYMKHFMNKTNLRDINGAMKRRDEDGTEKLFPFYTEDLENILKQESQDAELAMQVLSLAYFAKRNFTLAELKQALATRDGDTEYDQDGEVDMRTILYVTKGLISVERTGSVEDENSEEYTVRFDHLTRREYFDRYWKKWFPTGKIGIAKTCLTFLGFDEFARPCETEEAFQLKEQRLPFISYAVQFWGEHVRDAGAAAGEVVQTTVSYLKTPSRVDAYIQAAWTANTRHKDRWDVRRDIHPVHILAWFDLGYLIDFFNFDDEELNIQEGTHGQTALMYGCRRGNAATVRRLLVSGVLVNKQSHKGKTALSEAILRLHKDTEQNTENDIEKSEQIVALLLDKTLQGDKIDINLRNPRHLQQSALITSIEWGQTEIAKMIISTPELDVNLQDLDGTSALQLAACNGLVEVVEDLLKHPSIKLDLVEKGENRTALHLGAKYSCNAEVITELLKAGADSGKKDSRGGTAILRAIEANNEKAFDALLQSTQVMSDLSFVDEDGRSLMHHAAASGNTSIVDVLIKLVPDQINAKDLFGITPLHDACLSGEFETAKILLDHGASPEVQDKLLRDPLIVACQYGRTKLYDLFNHGNAATEVEKSAMLSQNLPIWSLATLRLREAIEARTASDPESLRELEPRTNRNALHCVLLRTGEEVNEDIQVNILQDLLKTGLLSADDTDKHGQAPIHLAAMLGNIEAVKILLSHEVVLDSVDRFGRAALRISCRNNFLNVAVALIEAGAEIEEEVLDLEELLFAALREQSVTAVGRLIEAGADRMSQDDQGRTPDMVAAKDSKLLGILKSTKSYRWKAKTVDKKANINLDIVRNTILEADVLLSEIKKGDEGTSKKTPFGGKEARNVQFIPFSSRSLDLKSEESLVDVTEIPIDSKDADSGKVMPELVSPKKSAILTSTELPEHVLCT